MESVKIEEVIRLASNVSMLVPLVLYFSRMKHASREVHIIGALIVVSGVCDLAGMVLFSMHRSTIILFNAYYFVLFFLLTWFYYQVLFANTNKRMVWAGVFVYLLSFILITTFVQNFFEYQTLMWLVTAIILIIYSIAYFFYSLSIITSTGSFGYGFIWINIGVMIYFCLNLFLFVMGNHVLTQLDAGTSALIWSSHNINNIIKNLLFAIGIYFYNKRIPSM